MRAFSPAQPPCSRPAALMGGGAASLPSGAVGVYYVDSYDSSMPRSVRNEVADTPVSGNIFVGQRRLFTDTAIWSTASLTITDANATAPDGTMSASTISGSGGWRISKTFVLPAGTYTLAVSVRWRGSGSADFQIGKFSDQLVTKTATSSWGRYSTQITSTGGSMFMLMYAAGGSSVADFEICDFELYAGSSDLGPSVNAGHIYLGLTSPTYSSGALDFSSGGLALNQFEQLDTSQGITVAYITKRVGAGFNASFQPVVAKAGLSWQGFTVGNEVNGNGSGFYIGSFLNQSQYNGGAPIDSNGNDWACFVQTLSPTVHQTWVNGIKFLERTGISWTPPTIKDFYVGSLANAVYYSGDKLSALAIWNRSLSEAEVQAATSFLRSRVSSYSPIPSDRVVIAVGDSITAGSSGTPSWFNKYMANASPRVRGINKGIGGATVSTMVGINSTVRQHIDDIKAKGGNPICICGLGANDLASSTASAFTTALASYLDTLRSYGVKVVVQTVLPRSDATAVSVGFNTRRAEANTTIRSWVGTHADAVADTAADLVIGVDGASDNVSVWSVDKVHPNTSGHSYMEAVIRPVLDAIT